MIQTDSDKNKSPVLPAIRLHAGKLLLPFLLVLSFCFAASAPAFGQTESRQLILEGFEFEGNTKTSPNVIIEEMTIRPGDVLTPDILAQNQQKLSQTNFFKNVNLYTRPGSEKGRVVVIVEVEERNLPYFQFEGGYNDLDGFYFVPAGLRWDNAFGRGGLAGLRWILGDATSKIALNYRNSMLSGKAFIDVELAGGGQTFVHYFGDLRTEQGVGFGSLRVKVGGTRGLWKHVFAGYRSETHNPKDYVTTDDGNRITNLPASIADDLKKSSLTALTLGLYADRRDNIVYPMHGLWGAATIEFVDHEADHVGKFPKLALDARFYQRVSGQNVFAQHFKASYTTEDSPFYERYYLGGANSLRGFESRRLTPEGWGTKLLLSNTELRFPLTKKNFPNHKTTGVVFFDAGGIWLPGEKPKLEDFYTSAGFGIRTKLPVVGLTRFDFAFPLKKVDDNFFFHISLGHTF